MTVAPEVKRRSGYNPNQPRDRKGRWVETGAEVRNSITNLVGKVTKINHGDAFHETTYDVQTADGKTQKWETSAVDVVRNRDGSAPSVGKPGTPAAHADTAHGAPGAPPVAPSAAHTDTSGLAGAIDAVYLPPSGTGGPQTDPVGAAIEQVYSPAPAAPAKVKLSDGSVLEGVQVTQLKPGDKIKQRKGTLYWHWVNRPKDENGLVTDSSYPKEGTIVSVSDSGSTGTGNLGSAFGTIEVTLDDGKIVRWNKTAKVDRIVAPVDVAVADVYDPTDGSGPKTPETSGVLTEAQQIAIKQKWKLPKGSVAELQAQLAAAQKEPTPSVADLVDQGMPAADATKEAKRLDRNAASAYWKQRTKLQAAIDGLIAGDQAKGPSGPQKAAEKIANVDIDKPGGDGDLASLDAMVTKTEAPLTLYGTFGDAGPGAILPGHTWFDVLALTSDKKDTDPIPVSDVSVASGYVVHQGWAQKIDGKSYLVEVKPDEDAASAAARMQQAAAVQKAVLQHAPPESHAVQRGIAIVNGPNPQDEHWAKQYNTANFKSHAVSGDGSVTYWNGAQVDPATLAHEFGHNVDSNGASSSEWISQLGLVSMPGQDMPWKLATMWDARTSGFYKDRFKETRPGQPITLGEASVTAYGGNDIKEDFAESVRLWMKDRRYGKIGYDPTTGDNLRFSDLYPERAKVLDAVFATKTDFNTPVRQKRQEEFKQYLKKIHLNHLSAQEQPVDDGGHTPELPWQNPSGNWDFGAESAKFGLSETDAFKPFDEAGKEATAQHEADKVQQQLHNQMVAQMLASQEAAAASAKQSVANFEDALAKGLIDKTAFNKLRDRRKARAYHLKQKGVPADEAQAAALAWEQAYIAEHWPAGAPGVPGGVPGQPWVGKVVLPDINFPGAYGSNSFILDAGMDLHPDAKAVPSNTAGQAKANIMAELAGRMNNPEDWERFRQYKLEKGGYGPEEFGAYTPNERQAKLDAEINQRIADWSSSSGDSQSGPVLMQYAAKQEFGLDAHPAPRMSASEWQMIESSATPVAMDFRRALLRHMYNHTQEELKAQGITHVKLYRGMNFWEGNPPEWAKADGKAKRPRFQPINSWSTNRSTSQGFSSSSQGKGVIFEAAIPIELIVGTARTGFGCRSEYEYVVMDADGLAMANTYNGKYTLSATEAAKAAKFKADAEKMAGFPS